jgi:hypothetical protein
LVTLLTGGLIAMVIDGSPVAIIHLMLWVGVYSLALSFWARSWRPTALMVCAVLVAAVLDAGYLWPMVQAQAEFPRLTVDTFTSIFSFLWFALLPMRGKVLPANGNGHELSVFIGPVIAYFIWKYRSWISSSMPREMKGPLSVVTAVSLVLGMGSLRLIHIPTWLSPFDILGICRSAVELVRGRRTVAICRRMPGRLAHDALPDCHPRTALGISIGYALGAMVEFASLHGGSSPRLFRSRP